MTRARPLTTLVLVAVLVAGMVVPAAGTVGATTSVRNESVADGFAAASETNNSSVNVTVGQQLSTVVTATSDEVQTDFEDTAFEFAFENANESERVEAVAERAETLRDRAENISEDYREATSTYRAGEINESEYAQRIAVLNSRAENLLRSYERFQDRAENVSALNLRAAGVNHTALNRSIEGLDAVTGTGPAALLDRFTGQTEGELNVEAENGLAVEVESEDGERSLEVEYSRDDDDSMTTDQSAALETARERLGAAPENGTWVLTESSVHADSGYYEFEFSLRNANETGEAEVRVDGSTGTVFRLEQAIEPAKETEETENGDRGAGETDGENESEDDSEFTLVVADGTPEPNATITVKVLSAGEPAANATVYVGDRAVGTTGDAGTVTLTLPDESATVTAVHGERDADLEFEFEAREGEDEVFRNLNVSGSIDSGTVTVSVTYEDAPVSGATVYANGERVDTTGSDGSVTFDTNATEELEVEVVKGEFEAELTFAVSGDALTLTENPHEGDGDKAEKEDEREAEDDEEDEDETTEDGEDDEDDEESEEEENDEEEDTETTTEDDEEEEDEDDETTTENDEEEDTETTTEDDEEEDTETTTEDEDDEGTEDGG